MQLIDWLIVWLSEWFFVWSIDWLVHSFFTDFKVVTSSVRLTRFFRLSFSGEFGAAAPRKPPQFGPTMDAVRDAADHRRPGTVHLLRPPDEHVMLRRTNEFKTRGPMKWTSLTGISSSSCPGNGWEWNWIQEWTKCCFPLVSRVCVLDGRLLRSFIITWSFLSVRALDLSTWSFLMARIGRAEGNFFAVLFLLFDWSIIGWLIDWLID